MFFRGLHCPVCKAQLSELERRLAEFEQRRIDAIAVSGETRERTTQLAQELRLEQLPLAYRLTEDQMRSWGLFISDGINVGEPALFKEGGLFLISPDHTVYYESILSMPVGRPRVDDLLSGIDYWLASGFPARGGHRLEKSPSRGGSRVDRSKELSRADG